jgi:hypothetical protein
MSTVLVIVAVDEIAIRNDSRHTDADSIELSEEFLYDFFVDTTILNSSLTKWEIELIRPNWGEIELRTTDTLDPIERAEYLRLLQEVIHTNDNSNLDKFLRGKSITSIRLVDRAKPPNEVLRIVDKLITGLGEGSRVVVRVRSEIERLRTFLNRRIKNNERILIEFSD